MNNKKLKEILDELEIKEKKDLDIFEIEKKIEESYKKGIIDGEEKAKLIWLEERKNILSLLSEIKKDIEIKVEKKLEELEKYLIEFSLLLVKKLISVELSERSKEIIKSNIKSLISQFKKLEKIEIYLNPEDYKLLRDDFEDEIFIFKIDESLNRGNFYIKNEGFNLIFNPDLILKNIEEKIYDKEFNQST
jgi:flagellar biosynthesis/type III secretory pathway protein FliH